VRFDVDRQHGHDGQTATSRPLRTTSGGDLPYGHVSLDNHDYGHILRRMSTHHVYLPDKLGDAAKEAGINLSGLLQAALYEEIDRMEALKTINSEEHLVTFEIDGIAVQGRITGELITTDRHGDEWYLTDDGRLIVYESSHERVSDDLLSDPSIDINDIINDMDDTEAMMLVATRLGITPVVDI
jgi:hypothetical protein